LEGAEELSLIAEIGVGFAGFLSIFLIFARRDGRFSPADGVRVRAILLSSFGVIFSALLPLILVHSAMATATVWRVSSLFFLLGSLAMLGQRLRVRLSKEDLAQVGQLNRVVSWGLSVLSMLLVASNGFGLLGEPAALPYLAALALTLGVATSSFVTLAFQKLI
jgi:hypothetical protein